MIKEWKKINNIIISVFISLFPFLSNEYLRKKWVGKKLSDLQAGKNLLDAGAGQCYFKTYCSHLDYVSQDFNQYDGRGNGIGLQKRNWNQSMIDIVSDITDIPVKNSAFDYVLCSEVLEHVPDPEKVIKELSRVLKKGGELIVTAPFYSPTHYAPFHFCTGFSYYWYVNVFKECNLEILYIKPRGNFFDVVSQELARSLKMVLRYNHIALMGFIVLLPFVITLVMIFSLLSCFNKSSDRVMCFGYHVVGRKIRQ